MSQPQEANRRRRSRKAPHDANTEDSVHTDEGITKSRPRSNNKKKSPKQAESALTQGLERESTARAVTPPQSSGGPNHSTNNDHPNQNGQKSTRKKKPNNNTTTPGAKQQRHHGGTPKQINMDAYAGPTFHASPAPGDLPIPKLFSKSAPANEQEVGISARLHKEESNGSNVSDEGPDSPSFRPSARVVSQGSAAAGPALFDMLMNADRQEKARQQLQSQTLSPPQSNTRENSISPVYGNSQHRPKHSRTLTDSQLPPLGPSSANTQQSPSPGPQRGLPHQQLGSPFGNSPHAPQADDSNLKRMLFSSPQQGPPPNSYYGGPSTASQWNSSPASGASGSPYASPASSNGLAASSRPAPISPYTQGSPSPSARRPGYPPYHNSNLRRELSPGGLDHTPPPLGNLPRYNTVQPTGSPLASPTQQQFSNYNSPYAAQGYNSPGRASPTSNSRRFSTQDALKSLGGGPQMSEMEERLRQMLRIGQLPPQGAHGSTASGAVPS